MAPAVCHLSLKRARMTCSAFAESMETLQKIRLILTAFALERLPPSHTPAHQRQRPLQPLLILRLDQPRAPPGRMGQGDHLEGHVSSRYLKGASHSLMQRRRLG